MGWSDRFAWSGEIPLSFTGLNPVALSRTVHLGSKIYEDAVSPSRTWERLSDGANDGQAAGPWGLRIGMNVINPATEQGRFVLPNFAGLWPSSGQLLIGLWVRQGYTMAFNPLMSTRGGSQPTVYLSTSTAGRLRHQVYGATGSLVLDQYEDPPWVQTPEFQYVGMLVDYDALTSRMFSVDYVTKASWVGPTRTLSAAPRTTSNANLDVFSLQTASYWTGGNFDEVLVAHPTGAFDLAEFADRMALGLWADAQNPSNAGSFTLTEGGVTATASRAFMTGAERVSWGAAPVVTGAPAGAVHYLSSDNGQTWQVGGSLPETFDGLMRWEIPLSASQTFTGLDVVEPVTPPPELGPISDMSLEQGALGSQTLTFSVEGPATWSISAPQAVTATVQGSTLTVAAGFAVGPVQVTVTLRDELEREASRTFTVTVTARQWVQGDPPRYPHAPVIVWGEDQPQEVIIDALEAVVIDEVNGAEEFHLTVPADHRHAALLINERRLTVAGKTYWIRRLTSTRQGRQVLLTVYAEAKFYALAKAGQIEPREFNQVVAGDVMTIALQGTGWTVGVANVTTQRTYELDKTTNPLELLRTVQDNHGGDLIFDNEAQTVSLVTSSGRDEGVGFFYGKDISESKKIVDTTSLITRLYAQNADGLTIAGVNGGVPYVEDFTYTDEVLEATYDFASGTSPFQMLNLAQATLANRSRPSYSYEVTVSDLSERTDNVLDRFASGDFVTIVDEPVGIQTKQRIVRLEYDVKRPYASRITLSARLRELGSTDSTDAGTLTTGSGIGTFDFVPFNLLKNGRFDNGLAHWASSGATVTEGNGTGDYAVEFAGTGTRWIEQTVSPDNRRAYAFSLDVDSRGPAGWVPDLTAQAVITYEDGSTETVDIELTR